MLKQSLQQRLQQKLSPQQIQLMKMLQIPTMELEQRIKEEMESNPALEEGSDQDENEDQSQDDMNNEQDEGDSKESEANDEVDLSEYFDDDTPDYKLYTNNHSSDDDDKESPLGAGRTFQDLLYSQLGLREMAERQLSLAEYLIGNLDESGYLRRDIPAVVNDLAFSQNIVTTVEELEEVLSVIQDLDPAGVGARDLKECLLIQIRRTEIPDEDVQLAETIIAKYFDEFTKKHYEKIAKRLEISEEELKPAIEFILHLNPKPGNSMQESKGTVQHVIPDFLLSIEDEQLKLSLNGKNAPDLKISREYKEMLDHYAKSKSKDNKEKEAMMFVKQKIDGAKWFIDAIRQRNETLLYCMQAIVNYQKEFFLTGDETKLRPMILKDIADIVGMDISTVSRVANSKYIQTSYTTYLLKYFFSESLSNDEGEEVSSREVKKILKDAIEAEVKRKPLTDDKLAKLLKEKGYNIARRTVAKYREQLNIAVARLRKEL
ncbi:MAG: RNA polymerase factor sigma-54 [Flavobacteriales bacterium]|nr:RNA polymerase factor sigma-54 [Flavobacteriales bacterium]